jgi:hypothetical protein
MRDKKTILEEVKRYESYLIEPEKYCEEEDDKGFYTGVVRALTWVLAEEKQIGNHLKKG